MASNQNADERHKTAGSSGTFEDNYKINPMAKQYLLEPFDIELYLFVNRYKPSHDIKAAQDRSK